MAYDLQPSPSKQPLQHRRASTPFTPLFLTLPALLNGMRWMGAPGSGKTRGIALTVLWAHLWHALSTIIIDPTGALRSYIFNKVLYCEESVQRRLWQRITYLDMAATDYIRPLPLYKQQRDETLFAVANRFPEVLKRQDPDLTSAPILGWNSLFECAIYAGQIAAALGRQLDFVAGLVAHPERYKAELRQALHHSPELGRAVAYFRQLMDPSSHSLRDRRTASFMNKLVPFMADPLLLAAFSSHAPGIDWAEEMRQGHTVLLDFGGETDRERRQFKLIWCFLEIFEYLKSRGIAGRKQPILLVIDEIPALLGPRTRDHSILGDDLHELITVWARNVGVKLCLAHQYPSQLEPAVNQALLQLGTQLIGNIQHPGDALDLARQFHRFDPAAVRKTEPVWMNVQTGWGRDSAPEIIDSRTTEFTADEQFLLVADSIRSLPKFHFLARPALGEGNLTGALRRVSLERLDAGLYPDPAIIAEVRRRLRKRDGVPLATLLNDIAGRRQEAIPVSPVKENAILESEGSHDHSARPLPARKRRKSKQGAKPAEAPAVNAETWQEELWQTS